MPNSLVTKVHTWKEVYGGEIRPLSFWNDPHFIKIYMNCALKFIKENQPLLHVFSDWNCIDTINKFKVMKAI